MDKLVPIVQFLKNRLFANHQIDKPSFTKRLTCALQTWQRHEKQENTKKL